MAKKVEKELRRQGSLTDDGWIGLLEAMEGGLGEDASYGTFVGILDKIAAAATDLWAKDHGSTVVRTTSFCVSGTRPGSGEVISPPYKPDGRFILNEAPPVRRSDCLASVRSNQVKEVEDLEFEEAEEVERWEDKDYQVDEEDGRKRKGEERRAKEKLTNAQCAAMAEYKLSDAPGEKAQNEVQVVGGACLLLFNDPRRTHIFAMSIEKHSTRLWYFDRGGIQATERFDCHTNPDVLIRYFLYMTFANEQKLGYDPTVRRMIDRDERQVFYIYDCNQKHYRTLGPPLNEEDALFLMSRGVRSWKVQECDAEGTLTGDMEHVIKDYWIFETYRGEGETRMQLCESQSLNKRNQEDLRNSMTTIITEDVVESSPGIAQKTLRLPVRYSRDHFDLLKQHPQPSSNRANTSYGTPHLDTLVAPSGPRNYDVKATQRLHYRTLIQEWCVSLYKLCDPQSGYKKAGDINAVFKVVGDLAFALSLLQKAGFIHRDISAGNCLAYWDDGLEEWVGKLSDFEYCKEYEAVTSGDPITGTLIFLAVEAMRKRLLFLPEPRSQAQGQGTRSLPRDPTREELSNWSQAAYNPANSTADNTITNLTKEFQYHPYYDLESLYWVLLWMVFNYMIVDNNNNNAATRDFSKWEDTRNFLFSSGHCQEREEILKSQNGLDKLWSNLHQWGWSLELLKIIKPVLDFRKTIFDSYTKLEAQPQQEYRVNQNDGASQIFKRWPLTQFVETPYLELTASCDRVLSNLKQCNLDVNMLSVDRVREQQQEAEEARKKEEFSRKSKTKGAPNRKSKRKLVNAEASSSKRRK